MVDAGYVRARVQEIVRISSDAESAHRREKRLWKEVLGAISTGHPDAQQLATEALKTIGIPFTRWFA